MAYNQAEHFVAHLFLILHLLFELRMNVCVFYKNCFNSYSFFNMGISDMLFQDQIIIPLTRMGLGAGSQRDEDPLLVVHPNYIVDQ